MPHMKFCPEESAVIIAYLTKVIVDIGEAHGISFKAKAKTGGVIDAVQAVVAMRAVEWADMKEALEEIAKAGGPYGTVAAMALPL